MILILPLLMSLSQPEAPSLTGFPELSSPAPVVEPLVQDPEERPVPYWEGSVSLGANWSGGNTKTDGVNFTGNAARRGENDRVTLGAVYVYSKNRADDVVNEDRYAAKAQYDYFLSEKTYALAQTSYDVDVVADLRSRVTAGAGMGRQFREDETLKLNGEAGLTWKDEEYPHGQGGDDVAARLAYNVTWYPSKAWEFSQSTIVLPVIDDVSDVYLWVDTRAKASLTESMFGQLQYLLEHDETPAAGKDMTDHRVLLSVGWKF